MYVLKIIFPVGFLLLYFIFYTDLNNCFSYCFYIGTTISFKTATCSVFENLSIAIFVLLSSSPRFQYYDIIIPIRSKHMTYIIILCIHTYNIKIY